MGDDTRVFCDSAGVILVEAKDLSWWRPRSSDGFATSDGIGVLELDIL